MKTIVVHGMLVKDSGRDRGDYSDVDFVYDVDDSVTVDDVIFYINRHGARAVPTRTDGTKLSFVVSVDSERKTDDKREVKKGRVLNRVGVSKAIRKDMATVSWETPEKKRRSK